MNGPLFPGQCIDPSDYISLAYEGIEPPDGLIECTGLSEGFVLGVPDAFEADGTPLHRAFGMDSHGTCYYVGLVPLPSPGDDRYMSLPVDDILADMRSDWVFHGGSHPLDTRDSMEFLKDYCSRQGIPCEDYGSLLDSIPGRSMEVSIIHSLPFEEWDEVTSMLMHERSSILRYGGYV